VKTTTKRTLLHETLTVTLIPTHSDYTRILQLYNIRSGHKPISTLRQLFTNVKDKDKPENRQGAVYKIKCCDCQATYIGETGRNLQATDRTQTSDKNGDVKNSHC